ncbi:MAG: hypothetical protein HY814_13425 [Candidatus Riflebacteria bacterium]|nr:hypothetical protein [Candidatus Riflebacteria bacterium]
MTARVVPTVRRQRSCEQTQEQPDSLEVRRLARATSGTERNLRLIVPEPHEAPSALAREEETLAASPVEPNDDAETRRVQPARTGDDDGRRPSHSDGPAVLALRSGLRALGTSVATDVQGALVATPDGAQILLYSNLKLTSRFAGEVASYLACAFEAYGGRPIRRGSLRLEKAMAPTAWRTDDRIALVASSLTAPILARHERLGVIFMGSRREQQFTQEQVDELTSLAQRFSHLIRGIVDPLGGELARPASRETGPSRVVQLRPLRTAAA